MDLVDVICKSYQCFKMFYEQRMEEEHFIEGNVDIRFAGFAEA